MSSCEEFLDIRSSCSHLTRVQSWSMGIGADANSLSDSHNNCTETSSRGNNIYEVDHSESSQSTLQQNGVVTNISSSSQQTNYIQSHISKLEIPTAYLSRKENSSFHVYQLLVKTRSGNEWSVYRRYSQFYALHKLLKRLDLRVKKLNFPPKKTLSNKTLTTVQDRRRRLEVYLMSLLYIVEHTATVKKISSNTLELENQSSNSRRRNRHSSTILSSSLCSDYLSCLNFDLDHSSEVEENSSSGADDDSSSTNIDDGSTLTDIIPTITSSSAPALSTIGVIGNDIEDETNSALMDFCDTRSIFFNFIAFKSSRQRQELASTKCEEAN